MTKASIVIREAAIVTVIASNVIQEAAIVITKASFVENGCPSR
jgi:hypothetical protein